MPAHQQRRNVFDAHSQFHRQKRPIACRVEHAGLTDHALVRKTAHFHHALHHRVERVADDDQNRVGAGGFDLLGHRADDASIGHSKSSRLMPGLRDAGGDHHHLAAGGVGVVVRAGDLRVEADDRRRLHEVERLAFRHVSELRNIEQDDITQFGRRAPVSRGLRRHCRRQ